MANWDNRAEPIHFKLPVPAESRILGFATIGLFLGLELFVVAGSGVGKFRFLFNQNPVPFIVLLALEILLPLGFVFPPRTIFPSLELASDRIRLIPGLRARSVTGESFDDVTIPPDAKEILLCHTFAPGTLAGYRIIVRAGDGAEQWVGSRTAYTRIRLRPRDVERLANALASATGLPVHAIIRRQISAGGIEETPWVPTPPPYRRLIRFALIFAGLPLVGGVITGWLSPSLAAAAAIGLALWLCPMLALYSVARAEHKRLPVLQALATVVVFSAMYSVCFVVARSITHPH